MSTLSLCDVVEQCCSFLHLSSSVASPDLVFLDDARVLSVPEMLADVASTTALSPSHTRSAFSLSLHPGESCSFVLHGRRAIATLCADEQPTRRLKIVLGILLVLLLLCVVVYTMMRRRSWRY